MSKTLKFQATCNDYQPGDERAYDVTRYGAFLGTVERVWLVSATEGGTPTAGWGFLHRDGRYGEGRTRQAAVNAAYQAESDAR